MNRTVTIPKEHEIKHESDNNVVQYTGESDIMKRAAGMNDESSINRGKARNTRPRRKRDKNVQVSKDKIPSARDTTSYISSWLMLFNKDLEDADFSRKACESLVKKLKDKNTDSLLRILIQAVATDGKDADSCIPIGRTLDGRLQVASRKGLPHLTYVKIFRNSEAKKTDLRHLPICQCAYDMKQEQYVCVNPWHYEKIVTSIHFQSMSAEKQKEKEVSKLRESMKPAIKPPVFTTDHITSTVEPPTLFEQPSINSYISMNPKNQLTYTNLSNRYDIDSTYPNAFANMKPSVSFDNELLSLAEESTRESNLKKLAEPLKNTDLESYSNLGLFLPNYASSTNMMSATASAVTKPNFHQFDPVIPVVPSKDLSALSLSAFTSITGNKPEINTSLPNLYIDDTSTLNLSTFDSSVSHLARKTSVEDIFTRERLMPTSLEETTSLLKYNHLASSDPELTVKNLVCMGPTESDLNETHEEKQEKSSEAVKQQKDFKDLDEEANKEKAEKKPDSFMKNQLEQTCEKAISLVYSILWTTGNVDEGSTVQFPNEGPISEFPSERVIRITEETETERKDSKCKRSKRRRKTKTVKLFRKLRKRTYGKFSRLPLNSLRKNRRLVTFSNRTSKYIPGIESYNTILQTQVLENDVVVPGEERARPCSYPTFSDSKPTSSHTERHTQQMLTQMNSQQRSDIQNSHFSPNMNSQRDMEIANISDTVVIEPVENYDITQMEKNMLALSCFSNNLRALREQNILPKPGGKTGNAFLDFLNNHSDVLLFTSQNPQRNSELLMKKRTNYLGYESDNFVERRDWFRIELHIINESLKKRWQGERKVANGTTLKLKEENENARMWNIHLPPRISKELKYIHLKKDRKGKNVYFQDEWAIFKYLQNGNVTEQKEAFYNAMFVGVSFTRLHSASEKSSVSCRWKGVCGLCIFLGVNDNVWLKNYSCCPVLVQLPPSSTMGECEKPRKLYPGSRLEIYQFRRSKAIEKSRKSLSDGCTVNTGEIKISYLPGNGQCAHSDDQIHIQFL